MAVYSGIGEIVKTTRDRKRQRQVERGTHTRTRTDSIEVMNRKVVARPVVVKNAKGNRCVVSMFFRFRNAA